MYKQDKIRAEEWQNRVCCLLFVFIHDDTFQWWANCKQLRIMYIYCLIHITYYILHIEWCLLAADISTKGWKSQTKRFGEGTVPHVGNESNNVIKINAEEEGKLSTSSHVWVFSRQWHYKSKEITPFTYWIEWIAWFDKRDFQKYRFRRTSTRSNESHKNECKLNGNQTCIWLLNRKRAGERKMKKKSI